MAKLKKKLKDVTGDGKFTYADVLKMRGVKPKKSMAIGGTVNPTGDPEKEPSTASRVKEGYSDFFSDIAAAPGALMNLLREGVDVLSGYDDVEREDRRRLRAVYGSPGVFMSTNQAEFNRLSPNYTMNPKQAARKEAQLRNMKFESAARRFNEGAPHPSDPEFSSMLPEAEVVTVDESHGLPTSKLGENIYPMGVNQYAVGSQYGREPYHGTMGLPYVQRKRRAYPMPTLGPRVNENNLEKLPKSLGYGGKVKMMKGGKVEYGIGGAVMGGINALMAGKGLAGAAGAAAKGFATPGSGIAQGAKLAGNLAQKSNNPMLQNIGRVAGVASNFLPGGNPMGAFGNLAGMFQQGRGGYVSKHRLLRG